MTNTGKIKMTTSNFGGYFVIQNAGGRGHTVTMNFLEANRRHFDHLLDGRGYPVLAIKTDRAAKFVPFCEEHGIEVEMGA